MTSDMLSLTAYLSPLTMFSSLVGLESSVVATWLQFATRKVAFTQSRRAISTLAAATGLRPDDEVLALAYCCGTGVDDLLAASGAKIGFVFPNLPDGACPLSYPVRPGQSVGGHGAYRRGRETRQFRTGQLNRSVVSRLK